MIIVSVYLLNNCAIIPYFTLKVISPHAPTFQKLSDLAKTNILMIINVIIFIYFYNIKYNRKLHCHSIHVANKIVKMYFVCALFTAM